MKKLFFIVFIGLLSVNAAAQETRFGIKGGVNTSNVTKDKDGNIDKNNNLISCHIGAFVDMPLVGEVFYFQPALLLTGKGVKYDLGALGTIKYNPYYADLQANFVFKLPIGTNSLKVFAGAGPYLSAGLFGKAKFENFGGLGIDKSVDIKFTSDENGSSLDPDSYTNVKRWDYGANILAGVEISRFVVSANFEYGLAKIQPGSKNSEDDFGKNRALSVSVGVLF